mmetsp:Transcript_13996/g.32906  ORF Transcript_13996/g.32906 Transcript_13996/m.32906 type:complete len:205 (-) Transcript_13996:461-1075(-)
MHSSDLVMCLTLRSSQGRNSQWQWSSSTSVLLGGRNLLWVLASVHQRAKQARAWCACPALCSLTSRRSRAFLECYRSPGTAALSTWSSSTCGMPSGRGTSRAERRHLAPPQSPTAPRMVLHMAFRPWPQTSLRLACLRTSSCRLPSRLRHQPHHSRWQPACCSGGCRKPCAPMLASRQCSSRLEWRGASSAAGSGRAWLSVRSC